MEKLFFTLQERFPETKEEVLRFALNVFLYQQEKQTGNKASVDDATVFFRRFNSSNDIALWLLDIDVAVLREITKK